MVQEGIQSLKPYKLRDITDYRPQDDFVKNTYLETVFVDYPLFDQAIKFYNLFMGYKEHPVDREEAFLLARVGTRINSQLFRLMQPKDEAQLNAFYAITPFHFFNNILRFMDGSHLTMAYEILERCKEPFLDMGGGTGGFSLFLARNGKDVTFVESNKMCLAWMKYVTQESGVKVDIIESGKPIDKKFNMIIAKDIMEHVINPGIFQEYLRSMLNKDGQIYMSHYPCSGPDEQAPMHFKLDVEKKDDMEYFKYSEEANLEYLRSGKYPAIPSNPIKG